MGQSDLLIYGHIKSKEELARVRARTLKRVVVVDEQVYSLYGERIHAYFDAHGVDMRLMVLPTTEENKDMEMVMSIAKAIDEHGIDRRFDPVIAIGGGVCMDIVGFAASIYRRRTPYVRVPTTLMGYVDASVGAKSGVYFAGKKNKLGCYLPPALAIIHPKFDESMCDEALYERIKFSQGQKMPLPVQIGESRLFDDITMDQCRAALELWPTLV